MVSQNGHQRGLIQGRRETPDSSIEAAVETIKELKLQREDDNIQKMIAKMSLMKQIQRKELT